MITPSLDNFVAAIDACNDSNEMIDVIRAHKKEIQIFELPEDTTFFCGRTFIYVKDIKDSFPADQFDAIIIDEGGNFYRMQGKEGRNMVLFLVNKVGNLVNEVDNEANSSS